jgi:homoserine dehydrogenase
MTQHHIRIGLFGFGCVGQGLYDVLHLTGGVKAEIIRICVKDKAKPRSLDLSYFTFDKQDILEDNSINTIVELIDDADEAYLIVKEALRRGKNVITANKKLLAFHLKELSELASEKNVSLLYEGSVCGSIPVIRNLEEYYDNDLLNSVSGIFNGSTNYILTKVFSEGWDYPTALKRAQEAGFAESDPTLDVQAYDPLFKTVILAAHAFGTYLNPKDLFHFGIDTLSQQDLNYASEKGLKIKLIAEICKTQENTITAFVMPRLIPSNHYLYNVENEYNGVVVEAAFSDKQVLMGKGAGSHPTGSAVLSDISACGYGYVYEYKKVRQGNVPQFSNDAKLSVFLRYSAGTDISFLPFEEVEETFSGKNYSYQTGTVRLKSLFQNREKLIEAGIFVARTV